MYCYHGGSLYLHIGGRLFIDDDVTTEWANFHFPTLTCRITNTPLIADSLANFWPINKRLSPNNRLSVFKRKYQLPTH